MKSVRHICKAPASPNPVNILLAYDSTRTCAAILSMLDRVSTRLRDKRLFHVSAFKFGLLENMEPLQWTRANDGKPEVAVVAFGEQGAPGAGLLRWLEDWARRHAGQEAALGLLPLEGITAPSVRRMVNILKDMAARHGLGFIYNPDSPSLFSTGETAVA